jgi:hypothetical protein
VKDLEIIVSIDFDNMSLDEIEEIIKSAQQAYNRIQKEQSRKMLAEAKRLAASAGFECEFTKRDAYKKRKKTNTKKVSTRSVDTPHTSYEASPEDERSRGEKATS